MVHLTRTALAAVRQCPISKRLLIHLHVIVVSSRNRAAIRAFFKSPFRPFNSPCVQPASKAPNAAGESGCARRKGPGHLLWPGDHALIPNSTAILGMTANIHVLASS